MNDRQKKRRLPRNRRVSLSRLPSMRLTERDKQIVLMVHDYGVVTAEMVEALFFPSRSDSSGPIHSNCLNRLKLLYQHGYLMRHQASHLMGHRSTFLYMLDERGAALVSDLLQQTSEQLCWRANDHNIVRSPFLEHGLLCNHMRVSFEVGARSRDASIANWRDDRTMRRMPIPVQLPGRPQERVELVPDAHFFLIRGEQAQRCCLELDRGTETIRSDTGSSDWTGKVRAYRALARRQDLRVLTVVTGGERRLQNLRLATTQLDDAAIFYFASYAAASDPAQVLAAPIWKPSQGAGSVILLP